MFEASVTEEKSEHEWEYTLTITFKTSPPANALVKICYEKKCGKNAERCIFLKPLTSGFKHTDTVKSRKRLNHPFTNLELRVITLDDPDAPEEFYRWGLSRLQRYKRQEYYPEIVSSFNERFAEKFKEFDPGRGPSIFQYMEKSMIKIAYMRARRACFIHKTHMAPLKTEPYHPSSSKNPITHQYSHVLQKFQDLIQNDKNYALIFVILILKSCGYQDKQIINIFHQDPIPQEIEPFFTNVLQGLTWKNIREMFYEKMKKWNKVNTSFRKYVSRQLKDIRKRI